jgi:putative phosphoribosyl transferase
VRGAGSIDATARAACQVARRLGAARVVLASPVAPAGTTAEQLSADELICWAMPLGFRAVGDYYRDFSPTTDQEVAALLDATQPQAIARRLAGRSRGIGPELL